MATSIISDISLNLGGSLRAPSNPEDSENKSSKPVGKELKAGGNTLLDSIWTGIKGGCVTYTATAVAGHFLRLNPNVKWAPLCLGIGIGTAGLSYYLNRNSNYQYDSQKGGFSQSNIQLDSQKVEALKTGIQRREVSERVSNSVFKLANSVWAGWRAGSTAFLTAGLAHDILGFRGMSIDSMQGACGLIGIAGALKNYFQTENLNPKREGRIKTAVKSIFQGFADGSSILLAGVALGQLFNCRRHYSPLCKNGDLFNVSSGIALFVASLLSDFSSASKKAADQKKEEPTSYFNRLKGVGKILGNAALSVAVPYCVGFAFTDFRANDPFLNETIIVVTSAVLALSSAIENYYSSQYEVKPEQRIRKRFIKILPGAFKTYAGVFAAGVAATGSKSVPTKSTLDTIFTLSIFAGVAQATISFFNNSQGVDVQSVLSKIYQKWKSTSKVKKLGLAFTSLAALSVWYLGGPQETYKFGNRQYEQTAQSVSKMYHALAFNEKSDQVDITMGKFIAGFSPKDEMERLADMATSVVCSDDDDDCQPRELSDFSCAQILQTCHLNATNIRAHKKVATGKMLAFHPDKHPGMEGLAANATKALSRAFELMRNNTQVFRDDIEQDEDPIESDEISTFSNPKVCSGQDEPGCKINERILSFNRKLRTPTYLLEKLGAKPSCTFYLDDNAFERSLDDCSDL